MIYLFEIGRGSLETGDLAASARFVMFWTTTLTEAIRRAETLCRVTQASEQANVARLVDLKKRVLWFRPID